MTFKRRSLFARKRQSVDPDKHLKRDHETLLQQVRACRAALRAENDKHLSRFWF